MKINQGRKVKTPLRTPPLMRTKKTARVSLVRRRRRRRRRMMRKRRRRRRKMMMKATVRAMMMRKMKKKRKATRAERQKMRVRERSKMLSTLLLIHLMSVSVRELMKRKRLEL